MIVVVDSGVWISAIEFGGVPAAVLDRVIAIDELAMCSQIEEEVLRVCKDKFGHEPGRTRKKLDPLMRSAFFVGVSGMMTGVCRDPNDDCIVECAVAAGAALIVTGDKDLLTMGTYGSIRVVTCRQYLDASAIGPATDWIPVRSE